MHILDNSPISKPAIGRLVTEEIPVWHLADNCLYVLPSNDDIDEDLIARFLDDLSENESNGALNKYDYEILEDSPDFNKHQNLKNAIADEKANFILSLYTPHQSPKQYLVFRSNNETLVSNIGLALYTAERISAYSLREAMRVFAKNNVDYFCEIAKKTVDTRTYIKERISDSTSSMFGPSFYGIVPGGHISNDLLGIGEVVTFRKKKKLLDRMEENLRKYKKSKDPQAEAELSAIFKNLDDDILIAIFSKLPKKQRAMLCDSADPIKLAEQSQMKLVIKKNNDLIPIKGTNGNYLLFLEKGKQSKFVHFQRKESFIVYLIYLIDKVKNDSVDTLTIKNHEELFIKLFEKNYDNDDGKDSFRKLQPRYNDIGIIQQGQLTHCYSDIRESISNVCEQLDERPSPFILMNQQDHLAVLKSNIKIHDDILNLVKQ